MSNDPESTSIRFRILRLQQLILHMRRLNSRDSQVLISPGDEPTEGFNNFNNWDSFTNWGNR